MNISNYYEKEFLAVRYAVMCQSGDIKIKIDGYRKLIDFSKKMKWI
jgi:hypothetical protein